MSEELRRSRSNAKPTGRKLILARDTIRVIRVATSLRAGDPNARPRTAEVECTFDRVTHTCDG